MRDDEYLAAFEAGQIRNEDFRHKDHLQLAWACIRQTDDPGEACARVSDLIRRFADSLGHGQKYHETLTVFWVRLLWECYERLGNVPFVAVIAHNPAILDKDFVFRFYPRELLMSPRARTEWIAPTLLSIGDHASETHPPPATGDALSGTLPRT